jgi:hypothetical protein
MHAGDDVDWLQMERTMPTFNEIIVTKKTDIAWDGGKATENLIPNDGDLVFDSTGGGRSAHQAPLLDELGWATDNNRADTSGDDDPHTGCSGSLAVLLAFGEPVTFTATVSPNSPPASPEPVTHAGDLVFDSTGGGSFDLVFPTQTAFKEVSGLKIEQAVIDFSPDQDELGWATDNNRAATGGSYDFTWEDDSGGELSVLHMDAPVASDFFLI